MTSTTTTPADLSDQHAAEPREEPEELTTLLAPQELARVEAIYRDVALVQFPVETRIGHFLAYLRTYASPTVSGLLAHTGHVEHNPSKRAADTGLMMYELFTAGLDSDKGRAIVAAINRMHHHWRIKNEDYVWVMGTFAVLGTQMIDRYGYRSLTQEERQAGVDWYRELGTRMGITDLPETYAEFADTFREYEIRHLRKTDHGQRLFAASWPEAIAILPAVLQGPQAKHVVAALTDEPARSALGLPRPTSLSRAALKVALLGRGVVRHGRDAEDMRFTPGAAAGFYDTGYRLEDLGVGDDHRHPDARSLA